MKGKITLIFIIALVAGGMVGFAGDGFGELPDQFDRVDHVVDQVGTFDELGEIFQNFALDLDDLDHARPTDFDGDGPALFRHCLVDLCNTPSCDRLLFET